MLIAMHLLIKLKIRHRVLGISIDIDMPGPLLGNLAVDHRENGGFALLTTSRLFCFD